MWDRARGRTGTTVIAAAIAALMIAGVAGASSRTRSHQSPVLSPRFRYVASDAPFLWTGARYALTWNLSGSSPPATLIDDQTGQRTRIGRPGCHPLGGPRVGQTDLPWIIFLCSPATQQPPAWELYSTATGGWLSVSPSPGVMCGGDCETSIDAAGRYWLEFQQATCPNGDYHSCTASNVFQNIQTGEVRPDPSGPTTMVDLDAPNLTRPVCTPLSTAGTSSLTFYGTFALATVINNNFDENVYLERCGTRLHRLLWDRPGALSGAPPTFNAHEVLWMAHPGPFLTALTIPGLQRFTIRLPKHLLGTSCTSPDDFADCIGGVALTNTRLYIVTASYPSQVWAAPIPLPSKRRHT